MERPEGKRRGGCELGGLDGGTKRAAHEEQKGSTRRTLYCPARASKKGTRGSGGSRCAKRTEPTMGTSGLLPTEGEWPAGEVYVPTYHRASREARHMVLPTNGRGKRASDAVPAAVHTGDTVNRKRDGKLVAHRGRERRRRRRMRKRRSASECPARSPTAVIDGPPRRVPNGPGRCTENDARVWQHDPKNLPCPHEKSTQQKDTSKAASHLSAVVELKQMLHVA